MKTKSKRNKIIIAILVAFFILSALTVFSIMSINKYIDTHTWATICVKGTIDQDNTDSFNFEREYLKGDAIAFGNVILDITDISHDGTVTFSVRQGDLYNETGKNIDGDTISKDAGSDYLINNGSVSLTVTNNRYE